MEGIKMKNVYKVYNDCMRICLDLNIPVADFDSIDVEVNSRAKKRWGLCSLNPDGIFTIQISDRLLSDEVSEEATFNTMIHELLHTCPNCMNHGKEWKYWANIINTNTCYNIKRTTSCAEKGIEPIVKSPKYTISCSGCNKKWYYNRAGVVVKKINRCTCPYCKTYSLSVACNR